MGNLIHNFVKKPPGVMVLIVMLFASLAFSMDRAGLLLGMSTDYDVIVVGSDPEGIAAAVSSARNGMRTLLVDDREKLGGLWTVGGLNFIDMNRGPDKKSVVGGIFQEFYNAINDHRKGKEIESFDVKEAEAIFRKMVSAEPNLKVRLKTAVVDVVKSGDVVVGVTVIQEDGKRVNLSAKRFIDASQDADIAAKAGAPYYVGMEDFNSPGEYQPMSLIFEMSNVDWKVLQKQALLYRRKTGFGGATDGSAWGFLEVMKSYKHRHNHIAMRGLNVGKLNGNHVLINSMLIIDVNPLDQDARRQAMADGIAELKYLAPFIIKKVPGFAGAKLVGGMPELYVRESRHVVGQYRLTVNDIIENRDFPDKIALGSYPLDIQRTSPTNAGFVLGRPKIYSIPFRCLVPKNAGNLLVVGRCASYDSFAHSSARTVPIGMATGQAAGVACSYSIRQGLPFELIAESSTMTQIQDTLRNQGARLDKIDFRYPYQGHWALQHVRFLRGLGLLSSGYHNDYDLNAAVPSARIVGMTLKCEKRSFVWRKHYPSDIFHIKAVSKEQAARILLYMAGVADEGDGAMDRLVSLRLINKSTAESIAKMPKFNNAAWFLMLQDYTERRMKYGAQTEPLGPHIDK